MKKSRILLAFLLVLACSGLFTSCTVCRRGCTVRVKVDSCLCSCGCCPDVLTYCYPYVIDYDCCEEECPECCMGDAYGSSVRPEDLLPLQISPEPYRLEVGDLLEISIFASDENTLNTVSIAPDGRVYLLFLDGIPAAGRTAEELSQEIETKVADIFAHPSVSVVPKIKTNESFMILGKVYMPGVYPLDTSINLRQAIGMAGGLALGEDMNGSTLAISNLQDSFVVRGDRRLNIDFTSLIFRGAEHQNIYLRPGDYIYIASALNQEVYIVGAVPAVAAPYKNGLTLVGALSPAYGAYVRDPYAWGDWHSVTIVRGSLDCPYVICVDFMRIINGMARDVYLQPGDIVYVPEKRFRLGRALARLAVEAFIGSFIGSWANFEAQRIFGNINENF